MEPVFVLDGQFLLGAEKELVVKELAINQIEPVGKSRHYMFKPPFSYRYLPEKIQNQNSYLKHRIHGLGWEQGFIDYGYLEHKLEKIPKNAKVYCKGDEKSRFLAKLLSIPVINLDTIGCPKAENIDCLDKFCLCPHKKCAVNQSTKFGHFLKKYLRNDCATLRNDDVIVEENKPRFHGFSGSG